MHLMTFSHLYCSISHHSVRLNQLSFSLCKTQVVTCMAEHVYAAGGTSNKASGCWCPWQQPQQSVLKRTSRYCTPVASSSCSQRNTFSSTSCRASLVCVSNHRNWQPETQEYLSFCDLYSPWQPILLCLFSLQLSSHVTAVLFLLQAG